MNPIFVAFGVALVITTVTGFIFGEISSNWCIEEVGDALIVCKRTLNHIWTVLAVMDVSSFLIVLMLFGKNK